MQRREKEFDRFDVFLGDDESLDGRELHLVSQLSGAHGLHHIRFSSYLWKSFDIFRCFDSENAPDASQGLLSIVELIWGWWVFGLERTTS